MKINYKSQEFIIPLVSALITVFFVINPIAVTEAPPEYIEPEILSEDVWEKIVVPPRGQKVPIKSQGAYLEGREKGVPGIRELGFYEVWIVSKNSGEERRVMNYALNSCDEINWYYNEVLRQIIIIEEQYFCEGELVGKPAGKTIDVFDEDGRQQRYQFDLGRWDSFVEFESLSLIGTSRYEDTGSGEYRLSMLFDGDCSKGNITWENPKDISQTVDWIGMELTGLLPEIVALDYIPISEKLLFDEPIPTLCTAGRYGYLNNPHFADSILYEKNKVTFRVHAGEYIEVLLDKLMKRKPIQETVIVGRNYLSP
jgi:hypothetical protein